MSRILGALSLSLFAASCVTSPGPASTTGSLTATSAYVFRGVPQTDKSALWADMGVSAEDGNGGTWTGYVWANMNLTSDTGDAVFPDGSGNKFSEIDLIGSYARELGSLAAEIGVVNYSFPNIGGASTTELYGALGASAGPLDLGFTAYLDVEEVDGLYLNGSVGHTREVADDVTADFGLSVGWMDEDQSEVYFGAMDASGISDLAASAGLSWAWTQATTVRLGASWVSVLDSELEDALGSAGIDDNTAFATLGIHHEM